MQPNISMESQIQAEVDQLRTQFPVTKDLYREACVLLFFRHGITPTANKLYGLVRKGSMSAPAHALDAFWRDLREKSRVRIESPDIPEGLRESAGEMVSALWRQAQVDAADNFSHRLAELEKLAMESNRSAESDAKQKVGLEAEISSLKAQLAESEKLATEIEKNRLGDTQTLAAQEKALKTLLVERDRLAQSLEESRKTFSQDLEKMNVSMWKAEDQYRMLEKKALLELEKGRQDVVKLEKTNSALRNAARVEQDRFRKENASLQNTISGLSEKVGNLTGRLSELSGQHKDTSNRLKLAEKKLAASIIRPTPTRGRLSKKTAKG